MYNIVSKESSAGFAPECMPIQFNVQILIFYHHHNHIICIVFFLNIQLCINYTYLDNFYNTCTCISPHPSCWSDPLQPDLGKQDSHHFECHLVSRLPQVLLLHCVPLHPRWLRQCHATCQQWHLPHSNIPPTQHHLQDWGGGCEEGRRSRQSEGKSRREFYYWECRWGDKAVNTDTRWHQCVASCDSFICNEAIWV